MIFSTIDPVNLEAAHWLCAGAGENSEYVRGVAELLIDTQTPGLSEDSYLTMDEDKDRLIEFLGSDI